MAARSAVQPANQAVWVMGIHRDEFRRIDGSWKISSLAFEFQYYTPNEDGRAKTPRWEIPSQARPPARVGRICPVSGVRSKRSGNHLRQAPGEK